DLEGLDTTILDAERQPQENRHNLKEAQLQGSITAHGSLNSTLATFQDSLAKLQPSSFVSQRAATSTDATLFTATADNRAELGNYAIQVFELAKAQKLASGDFSSPTEAVGSGTLNISAGGSVFSVAVTAGVNDTLADVRDAINSAPGNTGVTASLLTVDAGLGDGSTVTKLVLASTRTGAANAISVAVVDDDGISDDGNGLSRLLFSAGNPNNQLSELTPAQDARISVDGFTAFSATNEFSDVIEGVTIKALREADDILAPPGATLNISTDRSAVRSAIETFVASYNELVTVFNTLTDYDPATKTRGLLSGDASVNAIESQIRRAMGSANFNNGVLTNLSALGIATNRDGSVSLNDEALTKALTTNFDDLAGLFAGDDGIATKLDSLIGGFLSSGGVFSTREQSLQDQLRKVDDQRATMELRLGKMETRIRAQFSALDALVQQLNQTSDFLGRQLDASAQIVNRNSGKS
ncbi:MAG: flagellar filament capping protein FliD, partial [Spongiibacteraceae bacterium]|nr:flagellar filament capping protein FliD [Spongiibacteraceae bacterium]